MREFPQAVAQFRQVVQLSPDYALAVFQLGLSFGQTGDWDRAIETLKRALQLDPTNFSASYNLGAAYLQKKMVPEAVTAFRQCITTAPDPESAERFLPTTKMNAAAGQRLAGARA